MAPVLTNLGESYYHRSSCGALPAIRANQRPCKYSWVLEHQHLWCWAPTPVVLAVYLNTAWPASHNNCSLAGCFGEWRAPASVTSPVCRNPIHRNPFLIINQIHKYAQMTHTFFVTYECTKLLCVSLTRFYLDSFSFKENTYPVLNQRHISVDIRTAPFFYRSQSREIAFFKTDPSTASGLLHTVASHILAIATREAGEPGLARFLFDT